MNRIPSGIEGLDEILGGGIPEGDVMLLSGTCGTGKTIFAMQFLASSEEPGIYVSFEVEPEDLRAGFGAFSWDIEGLEAAGRLRILRYDPFRLEDILEVIENNIREIGAKRVVLDSISALGTYIRDAGELRRLILQISRIMKKNGCTTILTSEIVPGSRSLSRFGVEEFVSDGVIVLSNTVSYGQFKRAISVWKLRGAEHSRKMHPYTITRRGIAVSPRITFRK